MAIIRYKYKKIDNSKREKELKKLEKMLEKKGWTNLDWHPSSEYKSNNIKWELHGCPPNYSGPYQDYVECVAKTLHVPGGPFKK